MLVEDPTLLELDLAELTYGAPPVSTYSICACDLEAGQWGVATQSKFLAVGSIVPWAAPQVGAIATQSYANPRYGPDGLALLREGLSADEVVASLTAADPDAHLRQLGVVDARGARRDLHRRSVLRVGRRAGRLRASQHRATSSSPPRRSTRSRTRSGDSRSSARRPPPRLPRRGRRPRAATAAGGSPRRSSWSSETGATRDSRTPSSTSGSTTTPTRSSSCGGSSGSIDALFGQTPPVGVDHRRRSPGRRDRRRRLGVARVRRPRRLGRRREPRGAGRRRDADRPGRARRHCGHAREHAVEAG